MGSFKWPIDPLIQQHINISNSLGPELVTNGTFTGDASGWTLASGWAYSANTVVHNSNGTGTLSQAVTIAANKVYLVSFAISSWTVGTVTLSLGGTTGAARGANGTYYEYVETTNATGALTFTPTNTARFTLDTVSVKEVGAATADQVPIWVDDQGGSAGEAALHVLGESGRLYSFGPVLRAGPTTAPFSATNGIDWHQGAPTDGPITVTHWSADANNVEIRGRLSASDTIGTHAAPSVNNRIWRLAAYASDGTAFIQAGFMDFTIDGTVGTNDVPTRWVLSLTADGASSATERLRVSNTGIASFSPQDAAGTPIEPTAGMKLFAHNKSVADDASITCPAITTAAFGMVTIGSDTQHSLFTVNATGTVTLISNTAGVVANADTDTNLCIGTAAGQEPLLIKNRLGGVNVVNVILWYD